MRTIGRFILAAVIAVVTAALVAVAVYVPGFFDLYTPVSQDIMAFLAGIFKPFPFACWQVILLLLILLGLTLLLHLGRVGRLCLRRLILLRTVVLFASAMMAMMLLVAACGVIAVLLGVCRLLMLCIF